MPVDKELHCSMALTVAMRFVVMCSMAAATQGMDETANNGAQAIYIKVSLSPPLFLLHLTHVSTNNPHLLGSRYH